MKALLLATGLLALAIGGCGRGGSNAHADYKLTALDSAVNGL